MTSPRVHTTISTCVHHHHLLPATPVSLQANTGLHHIDLSGCPMDKSWKKLLHNIMKGQGGGGGGAGVGVGL